uniref:Uncharacterized protein AlNc14C2G356 n=1 Tax=Albugo laibachii Nc14 TaxID=890382 RepID=F0VZL8_9STRA|nr:conserved hypothetical protein [Albugo laibachii Nc14]|eukprot:CCA14248.1 conserved hypothetical protein [Albugo laibachii Nc14]
MFSSAYLFSLAAKRSIIQRGYVSVPMPMGTLPLRPDDWGNHSWVNHALIDASSCNDTQLEHDDLKLMEEVITQEEEDLLVEECGKYLKRRRMEGNHWDQVIVDFKEMERSKWSKDSSRIFDKIRSLPILPKMLQYFPALHVIELAETGYIKPHIDSIKFSGRLVAGLSLLSPSIMRFQQEDVTSNVIDALLPRRSFYVMTGRIRYNYTHQILPGDQEFKGRNIHRTSRISIMIRDYLQL